MTESSLWEFILSHLHSSVCLVTVVESTGSVPRGAGAMMAIAPTGETFATVGGGAAEARMIREAHTGLTEDRETPWLVPLTHRPGKEDSSGMICSGSQTFALMILTEKEKSKVEGIHRSLERDQGGRLELSNLGLNWREESPGEEIMPFQCPQKGGWEYQTLLGLKNALFIIGGGHVSLALSRVMATLDFRITVFDDRENLVTMEENRFAHEKRVIPVERICEEIPRGERSFVAIMTHGHRNDEMVLESLVNRRFKYLGMIGSRAKREQVYSNLKSRGIKTADLSKVHCPIGLPTGGHSPEEIAISIAAEILQKSHQTST